MLIDLSCPAEVFRAVLPTEDLPAVTLTLFNLSDRVIASVEVHLILRDENNAETERLAFRGRALNGRPHSTFLLTVPCAPGNGMKVDAIIEKVWYADNEVWRRSPGNETDYTPNDLPVSPALTNLKFVAGENAVGFPSRQENLWVCVCGRPNPAGEEICARCGQSQEAVFVRYNPEAVAAQINMREKQLDLNSRSMREDTIRLQRLREEEYRKKIFRRGRRLRIAAGFGLAVLLAAGTLFFAAPALKLASGHRALARGEVEEAKRIFESMGTFGDAKAMIGECEWQLAMAKTEETASVEALAEASAILRRIADKPEAAEKANEADLLRGRLLLETGNRIAAEEALALVPDGTDGKAELLRDCRMAEGQALLAQKDYSGAREIFLSLGDVPEAADLAAECLYRPAREKMEQGLWDEAIELLSRIADYRDSRQLTLECHYQKGRMMEGEGDLSGACAEYLMAGDWGNAKKKTRDLTLLLAEEKAEQGDMKGAHELYASLPDDEEAREKDQACRYALAVKAADEREYSLALELLEGIADEYEKTGKIRAEARYQKAKNAIKQEDWKTAAELLGSIDRSALRKEHRDVEELYVQACREAGIDPYPETPEPSATPAPTDDDFMVKEP